MNIVRDRSRRRRVGWISFAAVAAAVALCAGVAIWALRGSPSGDVDASSVKPLSRPSAVYVPKAEPVRHVEKPELAPDLAGRARAVASDEVEDAAGEEDDGGEDVATPAPIPEDDPELLAMAAEKSFSSKIWDSAQSHDASALAAEGSALLSSGSPEDRAMGGVMLFLADALDDGAIDVLMADEDLGVPLTLLDWVRDFGTEDGAATLADRFRSRGVSRDDLYAYASASKRTFGGGRSALDLWLRDFAADGSEGAALAGMLVSPEASYDVRAQGLLKLLEPVTRRLGEETLAAIPSDGDSTLWAQFADKIARLAEIGDEGDDCKIWDSQSPVVYFLTQDESALPARDLANYLEYALRRDDQEVEPNIEEGTWEFANDYLETMRPLADSLSLEEVDALDRIACALDKLVDYDPAFNPFETVEDDGDEPDEEDAGPDAYEPDDGDDEDTDEADDETGDDEDEEEAPEDGEVD